MAVASVSKITAASPTSFDAAVQEGLARANKDMAGDHRQRNETRPRYPRPTGSYAPRPPQRHGPTTSRPAHDLGGGVPLH